MDSGDGVHPTVEGHNELTALWLSRILEGGSLPSKTGTNLANVCVGACNSGAYTGGLVVNQDGTGGNQILIGGVANPNQQMYLGYNTSTDIGSIQVNKQGTGTKTLSLNPSGGGVCIGCTASQSNLFTLIGDSSSGTQITVLGKTNANLQFLAGIDTTNNVGKIQAINQGTASLPIRFPYTVQLTADVRTRQRAAR
jgi:hypothetical protein